MALTFQQRVEDYVGAVTNTGALNEWLTAGARRLLDLIPEKKIRRFLQTLAIAEAGTAVGDYRIVDVVKSGRRARYIDPGLAAQAALAGSLHQATTHDPCWTYIGGTAYVYPVTSGGIAYVLGYPNVYFSQDAITGFPKEAHELVVLYAAMQYMTYLLNTLKVDVDAIPMSWPVIPSVPTINPVSYVDAVGITSSVVSVGSFGSQPIYVAPTIQLPAPPADLVLAATLPTPPSALNTQYIAALASQVGVVTVGSFGTTPTFSTPVLALTPVPADVSITQTLPTAPSPPVFSFSDASAATVPIVMVGSLGTTPTYTAPSMAFTPPPLDVTVTGALPTAPSPPVLNFDQATASTVSTVTVGALGTPPTYLPPQAPTWPTAPSAFSTSATPPSPPVAPSYTYTDASGSTVFPVTITEASIGSIPAYSFVPSATQPSFSTTAVAPTTPVMPSFSSIAFTDLGLPAPPFMDLATHFDEVNNNSTGYLKNEEDVELAVAKLQEIQARIEDWRLKYIDDSLVRLRADRDRTAQLQIQQAQMRLQKELEEFNGVLKRYEVSMAGYRTQVEADLGVFRERTMLYNVEIQKELQRSQQAYAANLNVYQANVQRAITNAQIASAKALRDAELATDLNVKNEAQSLAMEMGKYEALLRKYSSEIEGYIGQIRGDVDAYQAEVQGYIGTVQGQTQQYSTQVQASFRSFEAQSIVYQATLQKEITNAQIAAQEAQLEAQLATDVSKQNSLQRLQRDIEQYRGSLEVYKGQLEGYTTSINAQVALSQTNYRKWEVARQTEIAKYNADLQNALNVFNRELSVYQSTVQKAMTDAQIAAQKAQTDAGLATDVNKQNALQLLQKDIAEYRSRLESYQTAMVGYQSAINADVAVFQANLRKWEVQRDSELRKYLAEVQQESERFGGAMAVYQTSVQKAVVDAQIAAQKAQTDAQLLTDTAQKNRMQEVAAEINIQGMLLQQYATEMQGYQATAQAQIAHYSANMQKWEADRSSILQRYAQDIQNAYRAFEQTMATYQASVQKALADAQIAAQKAESDARSTTEITLANKAQATATAIRNEENKLQRYMLEIQSYASAVTKVIQQVQLELAKVQAKFQMDNQKLVSLQQQYNTGLQIFIGGLGVDNPAVAGIGEGVVQGAR